MPARTSPPLSAPQDLLTLTERASQELQGALAKQGGGYHGLRLALERGPAGYEYGLSFAKGPETDDRVVEGRGVKIFVNQQDAPTFQGLVVDYVDSPHGSGFRIMDPNRKHSCGCESFES